jgi:pyridoxal 5'-phosphate synthase pdxT subunit
MRRIGVLALQGDFDKHVRAFRSLGTEACEVRTAGDLDGLSGLIMPGGESTTLTKLLLPEFREPLAGFCATHPVWGTCAGMIMLSKDASDPRVKPFGFLDLEILRNGYGRQVHSFEAEIELSPAIEQSESPLHGIFIRAPRIVKMGLDVEPLAWLDDDVVCVRQGHFMASSFHPELTDDLRLQRYFLTMTA